MRLPLLSCLVLMVAGAGCKRSPAPLLELSTDAPSRAGLVAVPEGVVLANEAGRLLRVRGTAVAWTRALGAEVAARPVASSGWVVAGTVAGVLVGVALEDGAERWRLEGEPPSLTPFVADAGSFYLVTAAGEVRAHTLGTGELRWRHPSALPETTERAFAAPVRAGDLLLALVGDEVLALSALDGKVRWRRAAPGGLGLAVGDGAVWVAAADGKLRALALEGGAPRWERAVAPALTSPPALAAGRVWVASVDAEGAEPTLLGVDPADGRVLVRAELPGATRAPVLAAAGVLLAPSAERGGHLTVLTPAGARAWQVQTDGPLRTPPAVVGDAVYVLGQDGRLLAWRLPPPG